MTKEYCDLCKKQLKDEDKRLHVRLWLQAIVMCMSCGKPIIGYLKKRKILKDS